MATYNIFAMKNRLWAALSVKEALPAHIVKLIGKSDRQIQRYYSSEDGAFFNHHDLAVVCLEWDISVDWVVLGEEPIFRASKATLGDIERSVNRLLNGDPGGAEPGR